MSFRSLIDPISQEPIHMDMQGDTIIIECRRMSTRVEKTFYGAMAQLARNAFNGKCLPAIDELFGNEMRNIQVVPMNERERKAA